MKYFCRIRLTVNILLAVLLLFQSSGLYLVHHIRLASVRHEMKQRLKAEVPEKDRILLKIPKSLEEQPNAIFERKHSREFRYKGEMYDILHQQVHGDTTWYYCIHDVKESGIFKDLDRMVKVFMADDAGERRNNTLIEGFFEQSFLGGFPDSLPAVIVARSFFFTYSFSLKENIPSGLFRPPAL